MCNSSIAPTSSPKVQAPALQSLPEQRMGLPWAFPDGRSLTPSGVSLSGLAPSPGGPVATGRSRMVWVDFMAFMPVVFVKRPEPGRRSAHAVRLDKVDTTC